MLFCAISLFFFFFFFLMIRRPPRSTLFPYPPLSRSRKPPRRSWRRGGLRPPRHRSPHEHPARREDARDCPGLYRGQDRKSTRLNSSHGYISYAVFCLKKKKKIKYMLTTYAKTIDRET